VIIFGFLPKSLEMKAVAVASSMAWQQRAGQQLPEAERLACFRRDAYRCAWRRADALFELGDALLTAPFVPSPPFLSCEPVMRRGHGMVYQGLARGRIDEEALRDVLVRHRPRDWPLAFAIDASTYPRPWAATSPDREYHASCCRSVVPSMLLESVWAGGSGTGAVGLDRWYISTLPLLPQQIPVHATFTSCRRAPDGVARLARCRPDARPSWFR
jgi:hypothetical protein